MNTQGILLISNKQDPHTDRLVSLLKTRQQQHIIRLNTEDFRKNRIIITPSKGNWSIQTPEGRTISTEQIQKVFVRRISSINVDNIHPDYQVFAKDEAKTILDALPTLLSDAQWMDTPQRRDFASNKIIQLLTAQNCDLLIPETLITTAGAIAINFTKNHRTIYKTLHKPAIDFGRRGVGIVHTTILKPLDPVVFERMVSVTPTLLQEYIEKQFELRIHYVAGKIISIKIDSQAHPLGKTDWRKANFDELKYSIHDLPESIIAKIKLLMKRLHLKFGIIDMVVTPENGYVFLEVNPNGNWLWLEKNLNTPIVSQAIVDWLTA